MEDIDLVFVIQQAIGPFGALVLSIVILSFGGLWVKDQLSWIKEQFDIVRKDLHNCHEDRKKCHEENKKLSTEINTLNKSYGELHGKLTILENRVFRD